jgi:uncharacterized coiled-coil DUF342 family protein
VSEERLDRLERILETTLSLTQQNREDLSQLTREVRTLAGNLNRTDERLNQFITQAESDRQFFRNELTGIRTEVSRIVEYLFGQRDEG